jgi:ribosomal protein S6--L-glutamate ligase
MILSYHPCFEADTNLLCAGREPDESDRAAMCAADAVVLPQGCREALYRMARQSCRHVFPNYDMRFQYPGKTGQARLFRAMNAPHPSTRVYDDTTHFEKSGIPDKDVGVPLVFKLDWGGEGETVLLLQSVSDLARALSRAATFEQSGQRGFVLQRFVAHDRTLRVVVIGKNLSAYWRIQDDAAAFGTSLRSGARIDKQSDPDLSHKALVLARQFCERTQINLAGFDFIFDASGEWKNDPQPLFLEINYFFGRAGLGGSTPFYDMLRKAVDGWLKGMERAGR